MITIAVTLRSFSIEAAHVFDRKLLINLLGLSYHFLRGEYSIANILSNVLHWCSFHLRNLNLFPFKRFELFLRAFTPFLYLLCIFDPLLYYLTDNLHYHSFAFCITLRQHLSNLQPIGLYQVPLSLNQVCFRPPSAYQSI